MDNTYCANDYIIKWFDINQYFLLNIDFPYKKMISLLDAVI